MGNVFSGGSKMVMTKQNEDMGSQKLMLSYDDGRKTERHKNFLIDDMKDLSTL